MLAAACALLSGFALYFSLGIGNVWPLAWIAPVPVVWLAFGNGRLAPTLAASFAAYAIGGANLVPAYADVLPTLVLVLAIAAPAFMFALAVMGARLAYQAFGATAGVLAFAAFWTAFDFVLAFDPAGGSALTRAASQVGAPALIQTASLVGFSGVSFALGVISAAVAAALRLRNIGFAIAAALIFAGDATFGVWRMSTPSPQHMRVALIASDSAVGEVWRSDEASARRVIGAYAQEALRLQGRDVDLIVLPENIAQLDPAWREGALAPLATAAKATGATIVFGFNTEIDQRARNTAWIVEPDGETSFYSKRRLVPGLETPLYAPGEQPHALLNGAMVVICKDLDFASMIRADVVATAPTLIVAPAWDFDVDSWSHARVAILRSVENGVPLARSARAGVLTISDRYGRMIAQGRSGPGFSTVVGDVPISGESVATPYRALGGAFGWSCLAASAALTLISAVALQRRASGLGRR